MFDYNEDKRSYRVTEVNFMAAVNPSTTTAIHTPAKNLHDTKDLQGPTGKKRIFLHLGHFHYMFGD